MVTSRELLELRASLGRNQEIETDMAAGFAACSRAFAPTHGLDHDHAVFFRTLVEGSRQDQAAGIVIGRRNVEKPRPCLSAFAGSFAASHSQATKSRHANEIPGDFP